MFDMPYADRAVTLEVESYDDAPLNALATLPYGGAVFMVSTDLNRGEWIVARLSLEEAEQIRSGAIDTRTAVLSRKTVERWEGGSPLALVSPFELEVSALPDAGETFCGRPLFLDLGKG